MPFMHHSSNCYTIKNTQQNPKKLKNPQEIYDTKTSIFTCVLSSSVHKCIYLLNISHAILTRHF